MEAAEVWSRLNDSEREPFAARNFALWAQSFPRLPGSNVIPDNSKRPWFDGIYDSFDDPEGRDLAFIKATQVGISTTCFMYALWGARYQWPYGFAYYLPHSKGMADLVKEKVDPIIESTPTLSRYTEKAIDSAGMKRIGNAFGYFRGLDSPQMRKSITVDVEFLDERDDMLQSHVEEAQRRMDNSEIKRTIHLGVPTLPGFGIDQEYELSTGNEWVMVCEGCKESWTIEETWPSCTAKKDGEVLLACPRCSKPADIKAGSWKERRPQAETIGFRVNGLMNPNANLKDLLEKWETGQDRTALIRNLMGKAEMDLGSNRLARAQVLNCCGDYDQKLLHKGPCWMGIDTGRTRRTSVAIVLEWPTNPRSGVKENPRVLRVWHWESEEEIHDAMDQFGVVRAVIDAGGEPRLSDKFIKAFPGRAFKCYYGKPGGGPGKPGTIARGKVIWNEGLGTVIADRTRSLDESHSPLYTGAVELPRSSDPEVGRFADDCQRLVRVVKDLPTGSRWAEWKATGEDHGRHAFNYGWLAMTGETPPREGRIIRPNPGFLPRRFRR